VFEARADMILRALHRLPNEAIEHRGDAEQPYAAFALRYPFAAIRLGKGLAPPSCRSRPAHKKKAAPEGAASNSNP